MEKKEACNVLSIELEEMQVSRKVSVNVADTIKDVIVECEKREKFWLLNTEIQPQATFVLYHASRNLSLIFKKMYEKFTQALRLHENPKVVDDTSIVFPELFEMCNLIDSLKNVEITEGMLEFIRRRVRNLRNTAEKVSMLPTIEEETRTINKNELIEELDELAEFFKGNLI